MRLVNLLQVIDVLLGQIYDLRVACAHKVSAHAAGQDSADLLRIRSFVTDLGSTTNQARITKVL